MSGITITPACDVSNVKSETITYIPVLPIKEYLGTISLLPAIRREITERINSAKFDHNLTWPEPGYQPPTDEELVSELSRIGKHCAAPSTKKADKDHLERALAGMKIARVCASSSARTPDLQDYAVLYGKKWGNMKKKIVKNAFRSDIHFLPADDQSSDETGLREHSVALLRFVISLPAEFLTAAQHVAPTAWGLVPPRIVDNVALSAAVEQQTLREIYLVITRSRYRYISLINRAAVANSILEDVVVKGLIKKGISR